MGRLFGAPTTAARWLLPVLLIFVLVSCGGGGGGVSQPPSGGDVIPPDSSTVRVRPATGRVVLPSGSRVSPGDLTAVTAWAERPVAGDGSFEIPVNELGAQLLFARDASGRLVVMGTSGLSDRLVLDSQTTAEALLFLNPAIARGDRDLLSRMRTFLRDRGLVDPVRAAVEDQLRTLGYIDASSAPLGPALRTAWEQIMELGRQGALPGQEAGASRARLQPPPPVRRSDIAPGGYQSGIRLEEQDDTDNNAQTYEFVALNYARRWVSLSYRFYDATGRALNDWACNQFLLPSQASPSVAGLVTGSFMAPGTADAQLALLADTALIKFEVWGAGVLPRTREPESRCGIWLPLGYDLFFEWFFPVLNFWLGTVVSALSAPMFARERQFFNVLHLVFLSLPEGIQTSLNRGEFNVQLAIDMFLAIIRVLVNTTEGQDLLAWLITQLGIRLLNPRAAAEAILKKVGVVLTILSILELGGTIYTNMRAWNTSRATEYWTATPPNRPRFYFVATLTWRQPTDIDLFTYAPNGEVAWWGSPTISVGELDRDDIDGYGPENFTLRRKLVGRYTIRVDYYRYSRETSGNEMPTQYTVTVTDIRGNQYDCASGILNAPGDNHFACYVDLDELGRITVSRTATPASVRHPGLDARKPARR